MDWLVVQASDTSDLALSNNSGNSKTNFFVRMKSLLSDDFKPSCHLLLPHEFTALQRIFEVLTLVCQKLLGTVLLKCNAMRKTYE